MTLDPGLDTGRADVHRLAAAARSILSCPHEVSLVVDGIDDVAGGSGTLELQERGGRPAFACAAGSPLAIAGAEGRGAVLTLASGLGRPGSADRDASLSLTGRLEAAGLEECDCCSEVRVRVALHVDVAMLTRISAPLDAPVETRLRIPLGAFTSADHDLNRGFLQRSTEHANTCHQDELRRAVASRTQTRLGDVVGVHLADLSPAGVELQWVDTSGAHLEHLAFTRPAATAADLGELLRDELHAGLC